MKTFTKDEIIKFADKLLIGLTDEEADALLDEFDVINENINQINNLDLSDVTPAFMPYTPPSSAPHRRADTRW